MNSKSNTKTQPIRAWRRYTYQCGKPLTLIRFGVMTTLATSLLSWIILPWLGVNAPYFWHTWIVLGSVIYVTDWIMIIMCKSQSWYQDNPYNGWSEKTKGGVTTFTIVLLAIIVLLAWMLYNSHSESDVADSSWSIYDLLPGLPDFSKASLGVPGSTDHDSLDQLRRDLEALKKEMYEGDQRTLSQLPTEPPESTSDGIDVTDLDTKCHNSGWNSEECKTRPGYQAYWDNVELDRSNLTYNNMKDKYTIDKGLKCYVCGNIFNGAGRKRDVCNPFLPTLQGTIDGVKYTSHSCLEPVSK